MYQRSLQVYVDDLTEIAVSSAEEVMDLIQSGFGSRHVAATKMNAQSSRSHTVFRVIVESRSTVNDGDDEEAEVRW